MGNNNARLIPPEEELERALYQAIAQARWELARGNPTPAVQLAGTLLALSKAWRLRHRVPEGEIPPEIRTPLWLWEAAEILSITCCLAILEKEVAVAETHQTEEEATCQAEETPGTQEDNPHKDPNTERQ